MNTPTLNTRRLILRKFNENDLEAFSKMAEAKRKVLTAQTKVDEAGKQARIAEESLSDLESNEKQWQTQAELLSDTDSRMIILQGKQRDIAGIGADFESWKDEENDRSRTAPCKDIIQTGYDKGHGGRRTDRVDL